MGNSDRAGEVLRETLAGEGAGVDLLHLRRYKILPCMGCYRCKSDPEGRCYLAGMDQSGQVFGPLLCADTVFIVSPIYFYHLPAQLKALVDRSQSFYLRKQSGNPQILALPERLAHVILIAGRPQGLRLFEGSLLTLRYFLASFNLKVAEPLLLRGLDEAGDLASSGEVQEGIRKYALDALGRSQPPA